MTIILITISVLYIVLIAWTWQSLEDMDKGKKVIFLFIGMLILYGITIAIYPMPQSERMDARIEIDKNIKNILVMLFTGINGLIILPQIAKIVSKGKEGSLQKGQVIRKTIILMMVVILCLVIEKNYMENTQEGIQKVYQNLSTGEVSVDKRKK